MVNYWKARKMGLSKGKAFNEDAKEFGSILKRRAMLGLYLGASVLVAVPSVLFGANGADITSFHRVLNYPLTMPTMTVDSKGNYKSSFFLAQFPILNHFSGLIMPTIGQENVTNTLLGVSGEYKKFDFGIVMSVPSEGNGITYKPGIDVKFADDVAVVVVTSSQDPGKPTIGIRIQQGSITRFFNYDCAAHDISEGVTWDGPIKIQASLTGNELTFDCRISKSIDVTDLGIIVPEARFYTDAQGHTFWRLGFMFIPKE